jgi:hypothetical protein
MGVTMEGMQDGEKDWPSGGGALLFIDTLSGAKRTDKLKGSRSTVIVGSGR